MAPTFLLNGCCYGSVFPKLSFTVNNLFWFNAALLLSLTSTSSHPLRQIWLIQPWEQLRHPSIFFAEKIDVGICLFGASEEGQLTGLNDRTTQSAKVKRSYLACHPCPWAFEKLTQMCALRDTVNGMCVCALRKHVRVCVSQDQYVCV